MNKNFSILKYKTQKLNESFESPYTSVRRPNYHTHSVSHVCPVTLNANNIQYSATSAHLFHWPILRLHNIIVQSAFLIKYQFWWYWQLLTAESSK